MDIEDVKYIIEAAAMSDDAVIIEGDAGLGKSAIVKQFATENNYHIETLFLSHNEVGDLVGIPRVIEMGEALITSWSIPIWLQRMYQASNSGKRCVLFLDELNRAPIDVRQSALQLVLERQIHEHILPVTNGVRTLVVAAINPADKYQVDELDPALLDRFLHITVEPDAKAWLNWARKEKINPIVRDFITEFPDRLCWNPADNGIGASPRSWAKLGSFIDNADKIKEEIMFQIIKGKIGMQVGSQFYTFMKNYIHVIKMKDIEDIVNKNKDKIKTIEELADLIKVKIERAEAIQKGELAKQLRDKYSEENDVLPLLAYLYALEVEICVAFLKGFKKDDPKGFKKIVDLDVKLNNKELFKRIVQASDKID